MGALRTSATVSVGGEVGENKLPLLQGGAAVQQACHKRPAQGTAV